MELVEEMDVGEVQKWLRHHQFSDNTMEKCKGMHVLYIWLVCVL